MASAHQNVTLVNTLHPQLPSSYLCANLSTAAGFEILTDQGNEFLGAFHDVCRTNNIKHNRTSAYSPPTNDLVERFDGTLSRALRKMVQSNTNTWDERINVAVLGYNCSVQSSTRYCPFKAFYSREPILLIHNSMLNQYIQKLSHPTNATPEEIPLE